MKEIVIFTNRDWHFMAHLLPIAIKAREVGYKVTILTDASSCKAEIINAGFEVIDIQISRHGLNILTEIALIYKIFQALRRRNIYVLHNFTIKPIIYGTLVAAVLRCNVINTFLGMGTIFINESYLYKAIRLIAVSLLKIASKFTSIFFITQNQDDNALLKALGFANVFKQCSVGLDKSWFDISQDTPLKSEKHVTFALITRVVEEKGVREYMKAASIVAKKVAAKILLVGPIDDATTNPISLEEINASSDVEYLGLRSNIKQVIDSIDVLVLPSYREGLSRVVLEAAARKKAIITTDAPGCREFVKHMQNGLLVRVKDHISLADAMILLATKKELIKHFAEAAYHSALSYEAGEISAKMVSYYGRFEIKI